MTWLVIGAGVSGLGAATYLVAKGEAVRVSEHSALAPAKARAFLDLGVELLDGGHRLEHLAGIAAVVVSPGLPKSHPLVAEARARRLPVLSEIDLALRDYHGTVLGVTGTNGKSTTCAMLGQILQNAGLATAVGGNFGDPPTTMLAEGWTGDYLVLELSSYQLEQSECVRAKAAVFTSFSHDHIARHGSMAEYLRVKWRLFDRLPQDAVAVLPDYIADLAAAAGLTLPAGVKRVVVWKDPATLRLKGAGQDFAVDQDGLRLASGEFVPLASLGVTERQNQLNAGFALAMVAHLTGRSIGELAPLLRGFRGLPHRCELIGRLPTGQPVINDSKSTNVESTLVALASRTAPVILMMGGQGKGESYRPILQERSKIAALVTFGASGPEIAGELRDELTVHEFPTLKAALAGIGGILERHVHAHGVLFSPACASFDEFRNYEERGDVFRSAMDAYLQSGG